MGQAQPSSSALGFYVDFNSCRACRDPMARLIPPPCKNNLGVRYHLQIGALNHVAPVRIQPILTAWLGFKFCLESHPAHHFCRVRQKLKDLLWGGLDVEFLDYWISDHALSRFLFLPPASIATSAPPKSSYRDASGVVAIAGSRFGCTFIPSLYRRSSGRLLLSSRRASYFTTPSRS